MHGQRFRDEDEARQVLEPKQRMVVNPDKGELVCYGKPNHRDHEIECLMEGAKAKKLNPFIISA